MALVLFNEDLKIRSDIFDHLCLLQYHRAWPRVLRTAVYLPISLLTKFYLILQRIVASFAILATSVALELFSRHLNTLPRCLQSFSVILRPSSKVSLQAKSSTTASTRTVWQLQGLDTNCSLKRSEFERDTESFHLDHLAYKYGKQTTLFLCYS